MALFEDHIINHPAEHSHCWLLWNFKRLKDSAERNPSMIDRLYLSAPWLCEQKNTHNCLFPASTVWEQKLSTAGISGISTRVQSIIWAERILTPRNSKLPKTPTGRQRRRWQSCGNRGDVSLCRFLQEPPTDHSCLRWTESYYKSQNALQQWCYYMLLFNDNDWCINVFSTDVTDATCRWVVSLIKGSIKFYCYLQKYTIIYFSMKCCTFHLNLTSHHLPGEGV